jgi:beta-glucosidase-like glycosyl hydrolase
VNIFRDPRWGRGQETCGEDPYLNAVLGVQTVLGMQGNDKHYLKTHACAKHYAVHSGPEPLRHSMNVEPTNRDLWETYLPAFKALVKKGNVREVMCAYQRFEGKPCCTSDRLLIDILRNKWGYDGLVVTDCDAINNFYNKGQHETHKDPLSASVDAVLNGTDLECGKVFMCLTDGLKKGLVKESDLDQHLRKTLYGRMELGMFDPAEMLPWAKMGPEVISSEKNNELAIQAARESMVLLENKNVLPLSKQLKTIAVVGPNADDAAMLNGNYGGTPTKEHTHTLLDGIKAAVPHANIIYNKACELKRFNGGPADFAEAGSYRWRAPEYVATTDFEKLAQEVKDADVIIVIGGISARIEGEGGDKKDIELPMVQQQLLRAMHATGRPVVFVNCSGSAIAFGSVEGQYDALLQAWYAGQGGAKALAEVLFGDYNPGGKLPVTFYRSNDDLPDFLDYSMKNRTYRYFTGKPQYAFGYGLSYTSFTVGKGKLSSTSMRKDGKVTLTVPVKNTGKREGTETIQVYIKALDDAGAPIKALKGFQKVLLKAGEKGTVKITLDGEAFEYYDEHIDELATKAGRYQILYGTSSLDKDLQAIDFIVE